MWCQAINRLNMTINAVTYTDTNSLQEPSRVVEKQKTSMSGVPVLVKDSIDVKGMPTVVGLKERLGTSAQEDAPIVKRSAIPEAEIWPALPILLSVYR